MKITCPNCGASFEPKDCAAECPLPFREGCHMVCCPSCGHRSVQESPVVGLLQKIWKQAVAGHEQ
jgi:hypothetical protein